MNSAAAFIDEGKKPYLTDATGAPLQLLHGSRSTGFEYFSLLHATKGSGCASGRLGIFLTDCRDNALFFADPDSGSLVHCRIRLENPLVHDCALDGCCSPADLARRVYEKHVDAYLSGNDEYCQHDGVIVKNVLDGSHFSTVYLVFDPDDVEIVAFEPCYPEDES